MLESYFKNEAERKGQGIPPLPLNPEETQKLCQILANPPEGQKESLLALLTDRIPPGVDPAAKVKAEWLTRVAKGDVSSSALTRPEAINLLGTMLGGFNVQPLISFLEDDELAPEAAKALAWQSPGS